MLRPLSEPGVALRISRFVVACVLLAALCARAGAATAFGGGSRATLGSRGAAGPGGKGFGAVKPSTVDLGGDPTGLVRRVHWQGWGHAKSTGFGIGWYPPPGKSVAEGVSVTVALHASSLGMCHSRLAYRKLSFFFKYRGRFHQGAVLDICGRLTYLH